MLERVLGWLVGVAADPAEHHAAGGHQCHSDGHDAVARPALAEQSVATASAAASAASQCRSQCRSQQQSVQQPQQVIGTLDCLSLQTSARRSRSRASRQRPWRLPRESRTYPTAAGAAPRLWGCACITQVEVGKTRGLSMRGCSKWDETRHTHAQART